MDIFEQASRARLRFEMVKGGNAATEDLWHIPLTALDTMAKGINHRIKLLAEESFLTESPSADKELVLKLDLIKHVIKIRQAETAARVLEKDNKDKKQHILSIIAAKKDQKLQEMDLSELEDMVKTL